MRQKSESTAFFIFLVVSLIPLFIPDYFVTLDGPAHLYNSRLIRELFSGNPLVSHFFKWNPVPEPNWSGHFLMAIMGAVLSPPALMRLIIAFIIVSGGLGFRKLILKTSPENRLMSWLIFPWLWNFPMMMGFLNYSIAISLMPWIWVGWMDIMESPSRKRWIILFLLCFISWFSHLMVFGITFFGMMLMLIRRDSGLKKLKSLLLLASPFLIAGAGFILMRGTSGMHGSYNRLPIDKLIADYTDGRPLIIFRYEDELPAGRGYAIFFGLLLLVSLFSRKRNEWRLPAGLFAIFMIILHFVFPDDFASGGIITVRLAQLSFLAMIWWIAVSDIPVFVQKLAAVSSLLFMFAFYSYRYEISNTLSHDAEQYVDAAAHIPEGSVVMPLNYSPNWLHSNLHGYAGASFNLLFLDNYEADMLHFPLHWNVESPEVTHGNFNKSNSPCILFEELAIKNELPDAVIMWIPNEANDSCTINVRENLVKYYSETYKNDLAKVWLKKDNNAN